jgi:hypothetical protein
MFAVKSRYPSLHNTIEYLSAKVIEDIVVSLSVTKTHNGGYEFLYVIKGTSVDEARMFFYGHV